ncbi:MAG: extracellular solute-binding protein [Planctomycetota bacterium]
MTKTLTVAVRKFEPFERSLREQLEDFITVEGLDLDVRLEPMELNDLEHAYFGASGEPGGLVDGHFDVAMVVTDWLAQCGRDGLLTDLRPLQKALPIADYPAGWSPSLTRAQELGDELYGVPYHDGPECLIYRKDLFEQAGLALPETWQAFHEAAGVLTDPAADRHGTVLAAFADGHNTFYDFCLYVWSRGGEIVDEQGRPTLDHVAARKALAYYRELVRDAGACRPGAREIDSVKAGELFMAGKVAMMANWFGFAAACETVEGSAVKGKVALAPLPSGGGAGAPAGVSLNVYWMLSIPAGAREPELAWRFIRHCASAEMDKRLTLNGAVGCRVSTWQDPQVNAEIPFFAELPRLHEHARTMPLETRLPRYARVIEEAVLRAADTEDAIDAVVADAQRAADELWSEA